ncbi:dolichol-phosphate mannosyltransferase [Candidatus Scalindua japonica]|uniref:Dolichol-phosphate mannosyltransferase n=1 Tax=Candidatus Scalindua japonica TaxID=1284222 RepID=A0A286TTI7_9BACT|nr:polyprenol monophosphomannose synthase [Candidatus Scalindua japonica]GAX59197.1 dolichol-phosphate mannosyltransferase [Candidatus Scalindua japonica]
METVIVIPTYNEEENIKKLLAEIFSLNMDIDVVVVDDSSPDKTADIVEQLKMSNQRIHLIRRNRQKSFAASYQDGFEYAQSMRPKYIFQMDADLSHPSKFIPDFLKNIAGNDLIIGSRYIKGIRVINWSIKRLAMSLFANRYIKYVLSLPFEDCTSGFRCWDARALSNICMNHMSSNGYAFLVEMVYIAHKNKYTIKEIPIVFVERNFGVSKMSFNLIIESTLLPWKLLLKNIIRRQK